MQKHYIWDLPTRLFHWLLAGSVIGAIATGKLGGNLIDWHGRLGLFILGLVSFRLVWGCVGPANARFRTFVRGPAAILAYLRGQWRGVGHNPLGALAVIGLLALTAAQAGSGLFANDDIAFQGPLADWVGKESSDHFRALHARLLDGFFVLVGLHVAAIAFYARVKRQNLLRPMLTGWQAVAPEAAPAAAQHRRHPLRAAMAFVLASAIASTTVYAAAGGLLPPPVPAATAPAPAW